MMQQRTAVVGCSLAAMMGLLLVASPRVLAAEAPSGVMEFARDLLKKDGYALSDEQRADLDRIYRDMREAERQQREAKDDDAKARVAAKLAAASDALLKWLEKCPLVKSVSLTDGKVTPSIVGPHRFSRDVGFVLFKIDAGGEGIRFSTYDINESLPESGKIVWIHCGVSGTTYALLGMHNLPIGRITLPVEFRREGLEPVRTLMDVITPHPGRLAMTILSDDDGQPTPAMVRIVAKTTRQDRRPSNAVDFGGQFDGNGRPSAHRAANLSGRLNGEWWCVPGPFDMTLPPDEYEIDIRRGMEHIPVFDTITVASGEVTTKTYRPQRWVDMRNLGWYSGDDHVHCQILSDADAQRLMAWVQAEDIHVANIVKMGDIHRTYFEQRGFGKAYRVVDRDYVCSPGQECPRTHAEIGHTLSMNTTSMVRDTDKYFLYDWVADTVHGQGGLWGYAHVNSGLFNVHRDMSINIPKNKCDFTEILQFSNLGTDLYYDFLNTGFKVTAAAGSDVPWGGTIGEVRMYAYTGDKPFSADAWFEAVQNGRTFVSNGPALEFRVEDALPGDEIVIDGSRKLRVRARAWGHPSRPIPANLQIVRHGEIVRQTEDADPETGELKLDFEIDAGNGCWIAAKVIGNGNTWAHTTPVYVVRRGLRFWRFDAAEELIAKRLDSLKQVEQVIADAQRKQDAGQARGDRVLEQLVIQGPELLKRVADARKIYEDLKKTAEDERAIRQASH